MFLTLVGDVRFRSDGHINKDGAARGVDLIASGSIVRTRMMKTEALKPAVDVRGLNVALTVSDEAMKRRERNASFHFDREVALEETASNFGSHRTNTKWFRFSSFAGRGVLSAV